MMDLLVRGQYVIISAEEEEKDILLNGAVLISEGRIIEVGKYADLKEKYPKVDIKGNGKQLLMPGLIDGHSHGEGLSTIQRGMTFDFLENGLIDWVGLAEIDPELNAMLSAIRHLRSGCTTMHHNYWGEEPNLLKNAVKTIQGYRKTGIRLAYSPGGRNINTLALDEVEFIKTLPIELRKFAQGMVCTDKQGFIEKYLELFEELYSRYNDSETRILLGPSWVQGSTKNFLMRVKEKSDQFGKVQIHLHALQTYIQKAYSQKKFGKSMVAYLDDLGLVDNNLTLGHGVFLTETDIELLALKGASITHHPSCNLAVRNGIAPVYNLYRKGVNVALGIDDKGINDDEDAIMELRMIHKLHRISNFDLVDTPPLSGFDVLKMGTVNSARVCGFPGEIGTLKPGMKADLILIDLNEILEDPWMSLDLNIVEIFIHRAMGRHVNTVIVGGKVVMENRKILTLDVNDLYAEVRKTASKGVREEQKLFAKNLQKIKPYYHAWYTDWIQPKYEPFYILNSKI